MPVIACKLPNGLKIDHNGRSFTLVGANIGEDLENVSRNGSPNDNSQRIGGFGLTTVSDEDAKAFEDWANGVTFKGGKASGGKLAEPFPALENGSILGPFADMEEARKEVTAVTDSVSTGFEGLDPTAEGIEEDKDGGKKGKG